MESTSRFSVRAMSLAVAAFSAGVTLPSHASMSYCQIWCMGIKPRSCLIDPVLARRP
jgi:hypothetical protein